MGSNESKEIAEELKNQKLPYSKYIIWLDPNINNNENERFQEMINKELKEGDYLKTFNNVEEAINLLKTISFKKTYVISSGSFCEQFFKKLNEIIKEINIIPEIMIFTSEKRKKEIINNPEKNLLFNINFVYTYFESIFDRLKTPYEKNYTPKINDKNDMNESKNMIDEDLDNFCFEYIKEAKDLILPIRYSMFIYDPSKEEIIRLNKLMIDKFYYNEDFDSLINQTFIDVDIPIDILVKYWLRAYTLDCYFHQFLNQELKSGIEDYDLYTRAVYYGLKNKSIDFLTDKPLYRGSIIFNEEVKVIENNLKIKKKKLPGCICYSRIFLSFTQIMNNAYQFMIRKKIDDSKSFCFYSIDIPYQSALKDMIISNADLEKLSYYKDEKEILFFPFSCFEIEKIEINSLKDLFLKNDDLKKMFEENNPQISYENLKYYEIKLNYLGKYKEEIENLKDKIPETEFAKNLLSTEIVDKNEKLQEQFAFDISKYLKTKNYIIGVYNIDNNITKKNGKYEIDLIKPSKKNKNEINKCEIYLFNKRIEYTNKYKFSKPGKYNLKFYFFNDLSELDNLFKDCKCLTSINLLNLKTKLITNMSYLFFDCESLVNVKMSNIDTKNVKNMSHLFRGCKSLIKLDLSNFNTKEVTNMSHMFEKCISLKELNLVNFNTEKVINMSSMFFKCTSLEKLNISRFKTKKVTDMSWMFSSCSSLKELNLSNFNTQNVTDMSSMFNNCSSLLNLNLSNFDTKNVTDMSSMFSGCINMLSLDLSNFKTDNCKFFNGIFNQLNKKCKFLSKNNKLLEFLN